MFHNVMVTVYVIVLLDLVSVCHLYTPPFLLKRAWQCYNQKQIVSLRNSQDLETRAEKVIETR